MLLVPVRGFYFATDRLLFNRETYNTWLIIGKINVINQKQKSAGGAKGEK